MICTAGYLTGLAIGLPTGIIAGVALLLGTFVVWAAWRLFR
jgi:hypothetical protein